MTMPALTINNRDAIAAMTSVAGSDPESLIDWVPDLETQQIGASWPSAFDTHKAEQLRLRRDDCFADIVRHFIHDDQV